MKIYCTNCGQPAVYAAIKPKFCSACGQPFDAALKAIASQKEADVELPSEEDLEVVVEIPHIEKLDVLISVPKRQTLGSVVENPDSLVTTPQDEKQVAAIETYNQANPKK
jgi:hypothetical protein